MKQQTLSMQIGFEKFGRQSKRELFLEEMGKLVPWAALVALIAPHYPKGEQGRPPMGLGRCFGSIFFSSGSTCRTPGSKMRCMSLRCCDCLPGST